MSLYAFLTRRRVRPVVTLVARIYATLTLIERQQEFERELVDQLQAVLEKYSEQVNTALRTSAEFRR